MQFKQITQILNKETFDNEDLNEILPIIYDQLKTLARKVKFNHRKDENLNTTSLVHEAYLKLQKNQKLNIEGSKHFYMLAAQAMRQILVDIARKNLTKKRLADDEDEIDCALQINSKVRLANEVIEIDQALDKLENFEPRLAQVVINHFYGGYSFPQIAQMLDLSERTVIRDWKKARAYIYSILH